MPYKDHRQLDSCVCGDFRRDHPDELRCGVCYALPTPWSPGCRAFRFANAATPEDIAQQTRLEEILAECAQAIVEQDRVNAVVRDGF